MTAWELVRHYAHSEALFRGTALAANLLLISIIATEKGFGAEGVLISAFIQLTISGLLEIPTGRYADRRGWYRSVRLGLGLKVLTTACYIAAVLSVRFLGAGWAWAFIAVESIIDSFANAFISGAYQSGYTHWYQRKLSENGISMAEAPPLFISSYRYGLPVRVLLPVTALVLGTWLFNQFRGTEAALIVYLCLLSFVMVLRFLVILRTRADLKPYAELQMEESRQSEEPAPSLLEIVEHRLNSLLLYAFATLVSSACGFYLYGEIYRSLSARIESVGLLWTGGTLIGLLLHVGSLLITRGLVGRMESATSRHVKQMAPAFVAGLSFLSLFILLFVDSEYVHAAMLFSYSLAAITIGSLVQSWIASHEGKSFQPALRATWYSLAEVIGLISFGLLAALCLLSDVPRAGLWIMMVAAGLAGTGLSYWGGVTRSEPAETKITLKQYLGVTLIGTAFLFFIAMSLFDSRQFVENSKNARRESHRLLLRVLKSGLREPVIQGSTTEAAARLGGVIEGRHDICIELRQEGASLGDCTGFKERPAIETFSENIYFDQSGQSLAAVIRLYGDFSDIQFGARRRLLGGLISYLILGGVLFMIIALSSRQITSEVSALLGDGAADRKPNFLIREFARLRSELSAGQKLKEESMRLAAAQEIAIQVVHDIRSPLAALEAVFGDASALPEEKRVLMRSAVSRIRDIANSLLEKHHGPARGKESSASQEDVSTNLLSSLLDPLITEKRMEFRSKTGVTIELSLDAASYGLFTLADPRELKRVISNLVNNSVEALFDERGIVWVRLSSGKGSVHIRVEDNGRGVEPDILSRLQSLGGSHGKSGGSGLGLSHARKCAESWGGRLDISSRPGKGTRVVLSLPQAPAPVWFVAELRLGPGGTVVILDDDPSIHHVWQGRLDALKATAGMEIAHAYAPADLRQWVRENPEKSKQAIYLLDYELKGSPESGLDMAGELGIGAKTILVTSRHQEAEIVERCLSLGARLLPKALAGFVPLRWSSAERASAAAWDAVLIDDDALTRMTWELSAARLGKRLRLFSTVAEFLKESGSIARHTPIYIDEELADGLKGSKESLRIANRGYTDIYLATGHSAGSFTGHKHIRGVVGKQSPWV